MDTEVEGERAEGTFLNLPSVENILNSRQWEMNLVHLELKQGKL